VSKHQVEKSYEDWSLNQFLARASLLKGRKEDNDALAKEEYEELKSTESTILEWANTTLAELQEQVDHIQAKELAKTQPTEMPNLEQLAKQLAQDVMSGMSPRDAFEKIPFLKDRVGMADPSINPATNDEALSLMNLYDRKKNELVNKLKNAHRLRMQPRFSAKPAPKASDNRPS
jgi:hypothetical protein